jgi:hypothetical protein
LRGVGGWLLLFCVAHTIFSPLALVPAILRSRGDPLVLAIEVGLAVFSIYMGISTWCVRPNALEVVGVYFITWMVFGALLIIKGLMIKPIGASPGNPAWVGVRILSSVIIWWFYFRDSRRVKDTFGSNL